MYTHFHHQDPLQVEYKKRSLHIRKQVGQQEMLIVQAQSCDKKNINEKIYNNFIHLDSDTWLSYNTWGKYILAII